MPSQWERARRMLPEEVKVVEIYYDDAWMRDVGPTFVINQDGQVRGIDWEFNAWGGKFASAHAALLGAFYARALGDSITTVAHFMEGGALETNILENLTLIFRNTRILSIEDGYTGTADGIDRTDARGFLTLSTIASGVRHIASLGESQT